MRLIKSIFKDANPVFPMSVSFSKKAEAENQNAFLYFLAGSPVFVSPSTNIRNLIRGGRMDLWKRGRKKKSGFAEEKCGKSAFPKTRGVI